LLQPACQSQVEEDGQDVGPVGLDGEHRAGLHALTIDHDRASAALGRLATNVRARQADYLTDVVDEEQPGLYIIRIFLAVDGHRDFHVDTPPYTLPIPLPMRPLYR